MVTGAPRGLGPDLLRGLVELGPMEPFSGDLSLELGVSIWLRRNETPLVEARRMLLEVRQVVVGVCGLDADSEPVPLVGWSLRHDIVHLVTYLQELLRRGAACAGLGLAEVVDQVLGALPGPVDEALGA